MSFSSRDRGKTYYRFSTSPRPTTAIENSILHEIDTEDDYRFNKYGRWEFVPPISLKSKRIQTLFIPFINQSILIFGEGTWANINAELHSSGCMIYQVRTSLTEHETIASAGYARVNDYAQVEHLPKIQCAFTFSDTGSNSAAFIGLVDDSTTAASKFLITTSTYIEDDVMCVGIGYRSSDTNFFVFHNDGSGTVVAVDTSVARDDAVHTVEVEYETTTSVRVSLFDINMDILYENTFNTDIPVTGTDLAYIAIIQNANHSVRYKINLFDYVRLEKTRPPLSATTDF